MSLGRIILHQVLNPLIFILIAAAATSIAIGEAKDAVFIFLVILINSALGTYQEYNTEKSAAGLQQMLRITARVRRNGREMKRMRPGRGAQENGQWTSRGDGMDIIGCIRLFQYYRVCFIPGNTLFYPSCFR